MSSRVLFSHCTFKIPNTYQTALKDVFWIINYLLSTRCRQALDGPKTEDLTTAYSLDIQTFYLHRMLDHC